MPTPACRHLFRRRVPPCLPAWRDSTPSRPGGLRRGDLETLLREVYAQTSREVEALETALEAIAGCDRRLVLLHYAPTVETIVGEPEGIWAFLGSGRLAGPIGAHRPDVVFHGHAHHGRPSGKIGTVPVHNVARQVVGGDFLLLAL